MELKNYKRIQNGRLPKYWEGKPNWDKAGDAATGVIGATSSIYNAHLFDTTADDYINKYGSQMSNVGGIGYTRYNDIDRGREMDIVGKENTQNTFKTTLAGAGAGAAAGSLIVPGIGTAVGALVGGLGGLVGGLFGGSHRKHKARQEMREAQARIDNYNEMNRSDALTSSLQLKQAEKYGDSRSQLLFSANLGKPSGFNPSKAVSDLKPVHTVAGKVTAPQNSFTRLHEGLWNKDEELAHFVDEGPNDTAPSYLRDGDVAFGATKNPETNNKFEDDAEPYIRIMEAINKNRPKGEGPLGESSRKTYDMAVKNIKRNAVNNLNHLEDVMNATMAYNKYNCGKPKFDPGKPDTKSSLKKDGLADEYGLTWWGNAVPSSMGALASLALYFEAKGDKPYRPDTYIANKYLTKGLETLGGLRINPYSTIQQLRDAEARTNYAVDASGGMSTAQKNLARIASLHGTQQQIGNMLNSIQAQNNAYKAAYANAMLQSGETEAQRRQAAKQYDLEYYSKAHAARQQMLQMGMRNFLDYIQQYGRNEFERKNALANIGLYKQSVDLEKEKLKRQFPETKTQDASSTTWTGGVPYVIAPEILDKIPGAITQPTPQFVPGPQNWQRPRNTWADNIMNQYGWR